MAAADAGAIVSSDVAKRAGGLADRTAGGRRRVWSQIAPAVPLLPILAIYTFVSIAIHTAHNDEPSYLAYAKYLPHILSDDTFARIDFLWHGPALPGVLYPFVALHVPVGLTRILVGPVPLFAAVVVFRALVRPYLPSDRAALIATYALALYPPFLTTVGHVHAEALAALLVTLAAFFMRRSYHGGRRDHLWAGVALGLLALTRLEIGYVLMASLVLSGIWMVLSRRSQAARRSIVAVAAALLLCAPWLVYTYSVTSKPLYWGDSGGLQLYWMTTPGNAIGDWHTDVEALTLPAFAAERKVITELRPLKPPDRDARLRHIALQNIKDDPKHYLTTVVYNLGRLLFNSPYSFENDQANGTSRGWGLMLYAIPNAVLLGLLSIAAFVAVRVRRRLGPEVLPIATFVVLAFAVHLPVAAFGRFLIPLVPVAAWLAVAVIAPHVRLVREEGDSKASTSAAAA